MSTLTKELTDKLKDHAGQGAGSISASGDDVIITIDVEQSERYAVGVRGIDVRPAQPVTDVRDTAQRVADGVQDVDEPLAVVEVDDGVGRAIVRSAEPEADEDGVTYWEADVQRDQTSLHRYRKNHATPEREVVTEPLPHKTVGRIAEQLADAVKGRDGR